MTGPRSYDGDVSSLGHVQPAYLLTESIQASIVKLVNIYVGEVQAGTVTSWLLSLVAGESEMVRFT